VRRSSALVRRIVLGFLVVLSLLLLTISVRGANDGPIYAFRMGVLDVVAPVERGLSRAWSPVQGAWDWTSNVIQAASENPKLERRIEELEASNASLAAVQDENEGLRDVVGLIDRGTFPSGTQPVVGRVIARTPSAVDRSIVIGLGSNDGVRINDPVLVPRGLIGRVEAVSANAASVALIINRDAAVSANIVGTDAAGVVTPVGSDGGPVMELSYVPQRVRVSTGDVVVTSGWHTGDLSSILPGGIPIGVVSSVSDSATDLYKSIQVTPFARFDRIDNVVVLVGESTRTQYVDPGKVAGKKSDGGLVPTTSSAAKEARAVRDAKAKKEARAIRAAAKRREKANR
jgi:rod shape-determining protein MreC